MPLRFWEIIGSEVNAGEAGSLEVFVPLLRRLQGTLYPAFVKAQPPS